MVNNEKGQIISKTQVLTGTGKNGDTWKKQSIVLEVIEGNFMSHLALDAMNERVDQLAPFQEGDRVEVGYVVRSREYNGRWYSDIKLINIRRDQPQQQAQQPRAYQPASFPNAVAPAPAQASNDNPNDDLPW